MKRHALTLILLASGPAALLLQRLCRLHPELTERYYSRGFYRAVSGLLSPIFAVPPFSLAELLCAALILFIVFSLIRRVLLLKKRGLRGLVRLCCFVSAGLFLFVVLWGLNYSRRPLYENLGYKQTAADKSILAAVTDEEIAAVNALRPKISYDKNGQSHLKGGFSAMRKSVDAGFEALRADGRIGGLIGTARANPKPLLSSWLMSYAGIEGIYIPFTFEPNVNTSSPEFTWPFNMSHEAAHLKGFAREEEANFMAYLACAANPDAYFQYSGHMAALMYLSSALYSADPALWKQSLSKLDKRAAAEIIHYEDYVSGHQGTLYRASDRINDQYLKSQGQTQGVASYDMFVSLLVDRHAARQAP